MYFFFISSNRIVDNIFFLSICLGAIFQYHTCQWIPIYLPVDVLFFSNRIFPEIVGRATKIFILFFLCFWSGSNVIYFWNFQYSRSFIYFFRKLTIILSASSFFFSPINFLFYHLKFFSFLIQYALLRFWENFLSSIFVNVLSTYPTLNSLAFYFFSFYSFFFRLPPLLFICLFIIIIFRVFEVHRRNKGGAC